MSQRVGRERVGSAADRVKDGDMLFAEDTPSARVPEKRSSGHQRVAAGLYLLWFTSLAVLGSRSALFPFLGAGDHDVVISAVAATTTAVFYGMNTVIPIVTRLVWRGYDDLDEAKLKKALWINTAGSLIHSAVSSSLAIICMWHWSKTGVSLLVDPGTMLPYVTGAITLGYLGYDTCDYIRSSLFINSEHILVHHAVMILVFALSCYRELGVNYVVNTLVCEVNSVFLHSRSLMAMAGYNMSSAIYKAVWFMLGLTFITTRSLGHGGLVVYLAYDYPNWTSTFLFAVGMACLLVFNVLNLQLLGGVWRRFNKEMKLIKQS